MAGVAPSAVRLLGPVRVSKLDARATSHRLSSRFPSLHSRSRASANWRLGQIRAASVREVDEEDSASTSRQKWSRNGPSSSSSDSNRRGPQRERAGESGRYATRTRNDSQPRSSPSNRYSQYHSGRNVQHRAPWEQGGRDRRSPPPGNRVSERRSEEDEVEELNYEDSRSGDGNHQPGGGQKSAMARIVEKLRAIGNENSSSSQMDFNKNRPATETSVFLPRYSGLLDCSVCYVSLSLYVHCIDAWLWGDWQALSAYVTSSRLLSDPVKLCCLGWTGGGATLIIQRQSGLMMIRSS
jgi:hypothetical protein